MSQRAAPPAFPEALNEDDDDVTWALQTAAVQWKRGAAEDAVQWLYRAIESAVDGGKTTRARQIQQQVNALERALRGGYLPNAPSQQSAPSVGLEDSDFSTETLEADAYTEVSVDMETGEGTGLHARRPSETAHERVRSAEEEVLDDADLIDEVEDLDAHVIALSHPRDPSVGGFRRFRLQPEPRPTPQHSRRSRRESDPASADRPPSDSFEAKPLESDSPPEEIASHSAPDLPGPTDLAPPSSPNAHTAPGSGSVVTIDRATASGPSPDGEQPTERSLQISPESSTIAGKLLLFREPPEDETTLRQVRLLPSEPSPSSREREKLVDSERGTSPDLSPFLGPPDSGPPTQPIPELGGSSGVRAPHPEPLTSVEPSASGAPPCLGGVLLSEVAGLEDLPEESQQTLVRTVRIHALDASEEVGGFGLALVLEGNVSVMPAVADYAAARVSRGNLVFSQGHLENGVALRVVAGAEGAEVATWDPAEFDAATAGCPWVGDDLRVVGDRFQALAGVTMGKMGEQLDDVLRELVVARCEVRRLLAGEVVVETGKPIPGMVVLGAGRLEIVETSVGGERLLDPLAPGEFLFASEMLQASPAPATARAGKDGALLLFAERKVAHELLVSVPPLLGIFV